MQKRHEQSLEGNLQMNRSQKMSSPQHKHNKESLLTSVAESIGSTLGAIATKASGMPEAISHSNLLRTAEREGKKFVRKSQAVARKIGNTTSKNVKTKKLAKTARRKVHGAKAGDRQVARPSSAKKKIARRSRRKK
jgi:hypothetical protein